MTDVPLPREEWDFSSCPNKYLSFCYAYEMASSTDHITKAFEKAEPTDFDEHGVWRAEVFSSYREKEDGPNLIDFHKVIVAPKGFPDVPFLKTDYAVLDKVFASTISRPIKAASWEDEASPSEDVHSLVIDWSKSDSKLMQSFGQWLKLNRPEDRPPLDERGRRKIVNIRADLKALGIYRLLPHFSSAEEAIGYTIKIGVNNSKGIYAYPEEWYRARDHTADSLAAWRLAVLLK